MPRFGPPPPRYLLLSRGRHPIRLTHFIDMTKENKRQPRVYTGPNTSRGRTCLWKRGKVLAFSLIIVCTLANWVSSSKFSPNAPVRTRPSETPSAPDAAKLQTPGGDAGTVLRFAALNSCRKKTFVACAPCSRDHARRRKFLACLLCCSRCSLLPVSLRTGTGVAARLSLPARVERTGNE